MKKKWMLSVLTVAMAMGLSACGGSAPATTEKTSNGTSNASQESTKPSYPTQSITVLVPNSAGGGNDTAARMMTKLLNEQKLVTSTMQVQNKPGGGQAVAMAEFVTKHKGDHSLYVASPPTVINNLRKEGNSPYGSNDLTPLSLLYSDLAILAVKADSKYKDLASFVKDLKENPSEISILGGSGPGSQDHLTVMLLADKSGVDPKKVKYIGYDGSSDALTSLLGDNGQALSSDLSGISEFVKAGKVRILAVAAPERLAGDLKDVPTYKEQGVDLVYFNWRGVFGPKDMSPEAVQFWDENLSKLAESQAFKDALAASGFAPGYMNAADFKTYLQEQEAMFKDILTKLEMAK